MSSNYIVSTKSHVKVQVTSAEREKCVPTEKTFNKQESVRSIKGKLELMTSASSASMIVKVFDSSNALVCQLTDDSLMLGAYPIEDGMRFHVEDQFLLRKTLEDESNVEKFEMPLEEYEKRDDTLKAYLEKNKLGKYNPEETAKREAEKKREEEEDERAAKSLETGSRCLVTVPGQPSRRAEVMFVGKTDFKPGWWVGVKYDEPRGKNDGSISGRRYFECSPKYGGFVKPAHVVVGDYPEEDLGLNDEL